jgi:cyclic pyranopterin monophosphate synthase
MKMVDVGHKKVTARTAVASASLQLTKAAAAAVNEARVPKGDVLAAARLAGVMAAKRTADLIPLCHPLPLSHASVEVTVQQNTMSFWATVKTTDRTGVEMEALTAVSAAALTAYDMLKSFGQGMRIESVQLEHKSGGRTGVYERPTLKKKNA